MNTQILTGAGNDRLIRLHDVPAISWLPLRRGGARLNVATVWRWTMKGCAGVKLATVSVGGTLCTSDAWLREFFDAVAQARRGERPTPHIRTPARRARDQARAAAELDAAGIR